MPYCVITGPKHSYNKISAIKMLRKALDLGLKEAQEIVDDIYGIDGLRSAKGQGIIEVKDFAEFAALTATWDQELVSEGFAVRYLASHPDSYKAAPAPENNKELLLRQSFNQTVIAAVELGRYDLASKLLKAVPLLS